MIVAICVFSLFHPIELDLQAARASLLVLEQNGHRETIEGSRTIKILGNATVTGRRSNSSLYDFNLATYDEGDSFDQSLAKGFVQLWGLPSKIAARRDLGS